MSEKVETLKIFINNIINIFCSFVFVFVSSFEKLNTPGITSISGPLNESGTFNISEFYGAENGSFKTLLTVGSVPFMRKLLD